MIIKAVIGSIHGCNYFGKHKGNGGKLFLGYFALGGIGSPEKDRGFVFWWW